MVNLYTYIFEIMDNLLKRNGGQGAILRPYYDPPLGAECQHLNSRRLRSYSRKGYRLKNSANVLPIKMPTFHYRRVCFAKNTHILYNKFTH